MFLRGSELLTNQGKMLWETLSTKTDLYSWCKHSVIGSFLFKAKREEGEGEEEDEEDEEDEEEKKK